MVLEDNSKKLSVEQLKFTRDKTNWNINTSIINKLYSFVHDKRIIVDNLDTLPYGYSIFDWINKIFLFCVFLFNY